MRRHVQIKRTEDFGFLLRSERVERGMTQAELAKKAEVSQRWLSTFESGKSPRAELTKVLSVARALGLVFLLAEETKPELPAELQAIDDAARAMWVNIRE